MPSMRSAVRAVWRSSFTIKTCLSICRKTSLSLFRVMQEALHNAMKRAAARSVNVAVRAAPGEIQLEVAHEHERA